MQKREYNKLVLFLVIIILIPITFAARETTEGGGDGAGGEFNQEEFTNALSDPEATATIPEGATYTSPSGETYEGPGKMKGGKYSGKVTPKGYDNAIDAKGATFKNGQIASAKEITIDGKVQKNVKNVKDENGIITFDEAEETLNDYPESAEQSSTPEQDSIVQTQAKGVTNYKKTADEETFGEVERFTATTKQGETINIINGVNVKSSSQGISASSADSTEYEQANIVGSENFNTQLKNQFYVAKADQVIIGNKIFNNIEDSTFNIENGKIDKAEVTSSKDNNLFKLPSD